MFKPKEEFLAQETKEKIEEKKSDLSKFLTISVIEFREKNPESSIEEVIQFLFSQREKYIYGEEGEREENIRALYRDIFETSIARMKPTKSGWFNSVLESKIESIPESVSGAIGEIYKDTESFDKAFSTAAQIFSRSYEKKKKNK